MLHEFLLKNQEEILAMTEQMTLQLAGLRPSSEQLKKGLPIFYQQLMEVLIEEDNSPKRARGNEEEMARAARLNDEPGMALASSHPNDVDLAKSAGLHGTELMKLGYTLSHVVHAYGSMCQAITQLATKKKTHITANEFRDLNRCLDIAIAGAVTEFQHHQNSKVTSQEVEHLGFLAHELRNALMSVNISLQLIKRGTVGFAGNTGQALDKSLKRMQELIDQSLTEVRLRVDPKVHPEEVNLIHVVDQIILTAEVEARSKDQVIETHIDPDLKIEADQQLLYSALSNLIQNAIKYTHAGGKIKIRANLIQYKIVIEVEDECGGLTNSMIDLFKPYEQQNADRKGLGLGLTIAKRAILLNRGSIDVQNLPKKGCIFKITLPEKARS